VTAGIADRRLYLCTSDRDDLASFLEAVIAGGVDVVQLRDKNLDARPLLERARIARQVCSAHGVPFILNDRPDLALEAGADGVHLGRDDAPCTLARRLLGPDAIVGHSTHSEEDLEDALTLPIDYLSAGPVVETPTKPGRPGTGIAYLSCAVARSPWPVFVTGGVTPDSVPGLVAAGARHFVAVRWLTESTQPERSARQLVDAIRRTLESHVPDLSSSPQD
jgi:thiamine-phosphate pyrophosphorylase